MHDKQLIMIQCQNSLMIQNHQEQVQQEIYIINLIQQAYKRMMSGQIIFNKNFSKPVLNIQNTYDQIGDHYLLNMYKNNRSDMISSWYQKDTLTENQLSLLSQDQIRNVSLIDFIWKSVLIAKSQLPLQLKQAHIIVKSYFFVFEQDGMFYGTGANMTYQNVRDKPPCPKSQFNMDSRCQEYYKFATQNNLMISSYYPPINFMYDSNSQPYISLGICKKIFLSFAHISQQNISISGEQKQQIQSIICNSIPVLQNYTIFNFPKYLKATFIVLDPQTLRVVFQSDYLQKNQEMIVIMEFTYVIDKNNIENDQGKSQTIYCFQDSLLLMTIIPEDQLIQQTAEFQHFKNLFQTLIYTTQNIFESNQSSTLLNLSKQVQYFKKFENYRALGICYNNIGNIHFGQDFEENNQSNSYLSQKVQLTEEDEVNQDLYQILFNRKYNQIVTMIYYMIQNENNIQNWEIAESYIKQLMNIKSKKLVFNIKENIILNQLLIYILMNQKKLKQCDDVLNNSIQLEQQLKLIKNQEINNMILNNKQQQQLNQSIHTEQFLNQQNNQPFSPIHLRQITKQESFLSDNLGETPSQNNSQRNLIFENSKSSYYNNISNFQQKSLKQDFDDSPNLTNSYNKHSTFNQRDLKKKKTRNLSYFHDINKSIQIEKNMQIIPKNEVSEEIQISPQNSQIKILRQNNKKKSTIALQKSQLNQSNSPRKFSKLILKNLDMSQNIKKEYLENKGEKENLYDFNEDIIHGIVLDQIATVALSKQQFYKASDAITKILEEKNEDYLMQQKLCQNQKQGDLLNEFNLKQELLDQNLDLLNEISSQILKIQKLCLNIIDQVLIRQDDSFGFISASLGDMFIQEHITLMNQNQLDKKYLKQQLVDSFLQIQNELFLQFQTNNIFIQPDYHSSEFQQKQKFQFNIQEKFNNEVINKDSFDLNSTEIFNQSIYDSHTTNQRQRNFLYEKKQSDQLNLDKPISLNFTYEIKIDSSKQLKKCDVLSPIYEEPQFKKTFFLQNQIQNKEYAKDNESNKMRSFENLNECNSSQQKQLNWIQNFDIQRDSKKPFNNYQARIAKVNQIYNYAKYNMKNKNTLLAVKNIIFLKSITPKLSCIALDSLNLIDQDDQQFQFLIKNLKDLQIELCILIQSSEITIKEQKQQNSMILLHLLLSIFEQIITDSLEMGQIFYPKFNQSSII
ncbi:tetratricopeptide repeat protein (macronuclear) [Tetrahymena thermophila SB210]|uniref:Tetratricopeptide repeat protein n=1 Tax=Tetrahymena thermophila (strain SB210) TaxID=312017 RepID=W7X3P9_TETTS|nr:tetratricopeptide repeat protein [Tetrahymena thermophila SB210]EWS72082.1 tetratricopeptide repeat protein [Tetrahymena thermophila SB210]|eukprot:XP_012655393.1 tetratricopeptide repeat protein [Tetrahymena thermophila SB210]